MIIPHRYGSCLNTLWKQHGGSEVPEAIEYGGCILTWHLLPRRVELNYFGSYDLCETSDDHHVIAGEGPELLLGNCGDPAQNRRFRAQMVIK